MKKIIIAVGILGIVGGSLTSVFAGYFNTSSATRCESPVINTLQMGSESNDVYTLQQMLLRGGYLFVAPNGYFGLSTNSAVKRFQNENGIYANGIVDVQTRDAINDRLCTGSISANINTYSGNTYNTGSTYVDQYDPYAKVISTQVSSRPAIYSTPQSVGSYENNQYPSFAINTINDSGTLYTSSPSLFQNNSYQSGVSVNNNQIITPATSQIAGGAITYNASTGYSYSIIPQPGILTINTPRSNAFYNEGDTVYLTWSTSNIDA